MRLTFGLYRCMYACVHICTCMYAHAHTNNNNEIENMKTKLLFFLLPSFSHHAVYLISALPADAAKAVAILAVFRGDTDFLEALVFGFSYSL